MPKIPASPPRTLSQMIGAAANKKVSDDALLTGVSKKGGEVRFRFMSPPKTGFGKFMQSIADRFDSAKAARTAVREEIKSGLIREFGAEIAGKVMNKFASAEPTVGALREMKAAALELRYDKAREHARERAGMDPITREFAEAKKAMTDLLERRDGGAAGTPVRRGGGADTAQAETSAPRALAGQAMRCALRFAAAFGPHGGDDFATLDKNWQACQRHPDGHEALNGKLSGLPARLAQAPAHAQELSGNLRRTLATIAQLEQRLGDPSLSEAERQEIKDELRDAKSALSDFARQIDRLVNACKSEFAGYGALLLHDDMKIGVSDEGVQAMAEMAGAFLKLADEVGRKDGPYQKLLEVAKLALTDQPAALKAMTPEEPAPPPPKWFKAAPEKDQVKQNILALARGLGDQGVKGVELSEPTYEGRLAAARRGPDPTGPAAPPPAPTAPQVQGMTLTEATYEGHLAAARRGPDPTVSNN